MAAKWDETCLDVSFSDYAVSTVIMLQAVCRGWLARKKLKEAQTQFMEIVEELDGPSVTVEWTQSALPLPVVCKACRKAKAKKKQQQQQQQQQQDQKHTCGHNTDKTRTHSCCCCHKPAIDAECSKCGDKSSSAICTQSRAVSETESATMERKTENVTEKEDRLSVIVMPNSVETGQSDRGGQKSSEKIHGAQDEKQDPYTENTDSIASVLQVQQESSHQKTDSDLQSQSQHHQSTDENVSGNVTPRDPKLLMMMKNSGSATSRDNREHQTLGDGGDDRVDDDSDRRDKDFPVSSVSASGDATPVSQSRVSAQPSLQQSSVLSSEPLPDPPMMKRVDSFHGDQTSVWDSSSSVAQDQQNGHKAGFVEAGADVSEASLRCLGTEELLKQRQSTALELLWVQQAIISRKKYLKLKMQMDTAT